MFEEYDTEGAKTIKFSEIETDFRELTAEERSRSHLNKETNLPNILNTLKDYMILKGKTLREIFGKTQ